MLQLLRAGVLKAEYLAALRVHTRHDMADSAVFARGVHGLKNQQQCVAVRCIEQALLLAELFDLVLQRFVIALFGLAKRFAPGRPLA